MTQDEIIEMAEQAGMTQDGNMWFSFGKEDIDVEHEHLVAFANLVAAKEREACALICDEHADDPVYCGDAIRARGEQA